MTKSKNSWVSILLYLIVGVIIFGLIRRTWKALLLCLVLGFFIVLAFPNIFLSDIMTSDSLQSSQLTEEDWQSIHTEQIFMSAGMCYSVYLAFLLVSGRFWSTVLNDKFSRALRDAEKVSEEDPAIDAELKQYAKDSEDLKNEFNDFCKNYPDSFLCKDKIKSRYT